MLEKNPLEDLRHSSSIQYTMVGGKLYDARTLNELGTRQHKREPLFFEREGQEAWVYCVAEVFRDVDRPHRVVVATMDITARKQHELEILQTMEQMREHELRQKLLLDELNHRVKNTLASVQSVAVQTLANAREPREARDLFIERLMALSTTHDLLVKQFAKIGCNA